LCPVGLPLGEQAGDAPLAARRQRDLTQGDLAERLGVSRVWLGQIERGKSSARIDLVFRVLNELDVTLSADIGEQPAADTAATSSRPDFDIDAIANTGLAKGTQVTPGPAKKKRGRK
ncbi:XRE family transcriptional regulator, partial [Herbaspirillum sp. HC18]